MHRRLVRWLPAVVAPVVVAAAVTVPLAAAAAAPDLPVKTPHQVLELVAKAKQLDGFSGEITQTADLGLPDLSGLAQGGGQGTDSSATSPLDLLTGTHSARVWAEGATKSRIALLDASAERDVVRDGDSVWLWDSKRNTAEHVIGSGAAHEQTTLTPAQLADRLLAEAGPSTTVTVDTAKSVAGRDAYTLLLTPKTTATTVGDVRIAVDAATGLPLQVQVFARGATSPAFTSGFTSVTIGAPAASEFAFTPPSGAKVTTKHLTATNRGSHKPLATGAKPTVSGTGWASIVTVPKADVPPDLAANATLRRITTAVAGGRVLHTSLVNVLLTDDGRVLAGAVPVDALTAAAG